MLTGQETVREVFDRSPQAAGVLHKYGITVEAAEHFRFKNLAHAAIVLRIPLRKLLDDLAAVTGESVVDVKVKGIQAYHKPGVRSGGLENIQRVIAVHSGKGGVGKTFVAVNLAAFLADKGLKIGLLDADVDCPNILHMLNGEGRTPGEDKLLADENKMIVPLEKFGMKIVSMASLLEKEDEALLWRGPIVSRVLEQFLYDVHWGDLDVLVVDLPPGTSDIPLTLYHMLPRSEVLLVTTPHQLGLLDAKKSAAMAKKLNVKILGIAENMGGEIFGNESSKSVADKLGVPFLGSIPMHAAYAQIHAAGRPHVLDSDELRGFYENLWKLAEGRDNNGKK